MSQKPKTAAPHADIHDQDANRASDARADTISSSSSFCNEQIGQFLNGSDGEHEVVAGSSSSSSSSSCSRHLTASPVAKYQATQIYESDDDKTSPIDYFIPISAAEASPHAYPPSYPAINAKFIQRQHIPSFSDVSAVSSLLQILRSYSPVVIASSNDTFREVKDHLMDLFQISLRTVILAWYLAAEDGEPGDYLRVTSSRSPSIVSRDEPISCTVLFSTESVKSRFLVDLGWQPKRVVLLRMLSLPSKQPDHVDDDLWMWMSSIATKVSFLDLEHAMLANEAIDILCSNDYDEQAYLRGVVRLFSVVNFLKFASYHDELKAAIKLTAVRRQESARVVRASSRRPSLDGSDVFPLFG
jgi:hypothetical protein